MTSASDHRVYLWRSVQISYEHPLPYASGIVVFQSWKVVPVLDRVYIITYPILLLHT